MDTVKKTWQRTKKTIEKLSKIESEKLSLQGKEATLFLLQKKVDYLAREIEFRKAVLERKAAKKAL